MGTPHNLDDGRILTRLPGVGAVRAARLIAYHGNDLWDALDKHPVQALSCPGGLSASQAQIAAGAWRAISDEICLRKALKAVGLQSHATRLVALHGADVLRAIRQDPYRLVDAGAEFERVDKLAQHLDQADRDEGDLRVQAALYAAALANEKLGNSCLPASELLDAAAQLLRCNRTIDSTQIGALEIRGRLVSNGATVWTSRAHRAERDVAAHVHRLLRAARPWPPLEHTGPLTHTQQYALHACTAHGISICLGGAGTGKTFLIAALSRAAIARGIKVAACAPTGRAARTIERITDRPASTIHRLLEWNAHPDGRPGPARTATDPLSCDLLIIDEASLLDVDLFAHLLDALPDGCHLALFGDDKQLPSVGHGRVLGDLIDSGEMPTTVLTEVMRHSSRSAIALAARDISTGRWPADAIATAGNAFSICPTRPVHIAAAIAELVSEELPGRYDVDPINDILVLAPGKHGPAGTHALNATLAQVLNSQAPRNAAGIAGGDRVLWTINDNDVGLANGTVLELAPRTTAPGVDNVPIAAFADDRPLLLPATSHHQLLPAWALTVHKAQGLQTPIVVVAMTTQATHPALLNRAMLYTAITRASQTVVICGEIAAIRAAIARDSTTRQTGLARRLVAHGRSMPSAAYAALRGV